MTSAEFFREKTLPSKAGMIWYSGKGERILRNPGLYDTLV
jgi:hypothetical protein